MADRACRNFQPNIFNKNKCQNCFKLQDAHRCSQSSLDGKGYSFGFGGSSMSREKAIKQRTVVKSGLLSLTYLSHEVLIQDKTKAQHTKWQKRWFILNSAGVLDYFIYDEQHGATDIQVGNINVDDCTNIFVGEVDTGESFSIGLKSSDVNYYLRAENRLDMDNWSKVLKPFIRGGNGAKMAVPPAPPQRANVEPAGSVSMEETIASVSSSSLSRVPSLGKGTTACRPATPPRSSSTHPKTKFGPADNDQHPSLESIMSQLEKLREENRTLREQQPSSSVKHRESIHILEQDLKSKNNRIKELEIDHAKCKDYQKAVIFQEKELQEARSTIKDLRAQVAEADKKLRQQKGKVNIHAKELAEAKADLEEANSIISIHKANIESLKEELASVKHVASERQGRIILTDDEPESDQFLNALQASGEDGGKKDIETKLGLLMEKLRLNERELMLKTRELEKANDSRSKVAKYTRSLLQELETKLSNNERKLAETENQLRNKNLELEYENEQKSMIEKEKEKLAAKVERLVDEKKRAGLPKEAVLLMNEARNETKSENFAQLETKLLETQEQLEDVKQRSSVEKKALEEEIESLEADIKAMQLISNENETKVRETQSSLLAANKELQKSREEFRDVKYELEKKSRERSSSDADTKLRDLMKENSELKGKSTEFENKLHQIDDKLCYSLEKEFALTEENERILQEKKSLENRVLDLEEKVSSSKDMISALKMKLSEAICLNDSKTEADEHKIEQLERTLIEKNKLLEEFESSLKERTREISELPIRIEQDSELLMQSESNIDKEIICELESQLEEMKNVLDKSQEKLSDKEKEIAKLEKELHEVKRELRLLTSTKEDSNKVDELEMKLAEREDKIAECEETIRSAYDVIAEYKENLNALSSKDKDNLEHVKDLENKLAALELEADECRNKLAKAEEKSLEFEVEEKLLNAELQKCKKEESTVTSLTTRGNENEFLALTERVKRLDKELEIKSTKFVASEEKVVELAEELAKRLQLEQETAEWIEGVEKSFEKTESDLNNAKKMLLAKAQELDNEKYNILDIVELSRKYVSELETSLAEEKAQKMELEKRVGEGRDRTDGRNDKSLEELQAKVASCERERDIERRRVQQMAEELMQTRQRMTEEMDAARESHQKDMKKLNDDTLKVSGAARTEGDELRLRLTSRVITLQSDISELKAAQQTTIEKLKARHKRELEETRREAILETSMRQPIAEESAEEELNATMNDMEAEMKGMETRYEAQMDLLKQNHHREIDKLNRSSDGRQQLGDQAEVAQLQSDMEKMSAKYADEIEQLKVYHAEEMEQLKKDMATVIQASLGGPSSQTKDHTADTATQQLKARVRELEGELDGINDKYNQQLKVQREAQQKELDEIRDDMMTVIQAIKSQKYELEPDTEQIQQLRREYEERIESLNEEHERQLRERDLSPGVSFTVTQEPDDESQQAERIRDLEHEVQRLRTKYEKQLSVKQNKHEEDMNQLKLDMMVAIQVARSGNTSPVNEDESNESGDTVRQAGMKLSLEAALRRVKDLEEENRKQHKEFADEKDELEKAVKRQEAATMFGLRRNEEMSNKIYQMQKEMEDIDRKYMKEINMYKDAFEREKEEKGDVGDTAKIMCDNDGLKLEMEELNLRMEEMEVQHENELRMYKDKLDEEKLLNVDDLRLHIKGLEDSIEEMKLEHERELDEVKEGHSKSINNLKIEHEKELREAKSSGASKTKVVVKDEKYETKVRNLEFKIEELESLLEVKKRRHKEEVKSLKERLDEEIQRHTEDVRELKGRVLDGGRRGSTSASAGASEYFRKQISDLRAENRRLKQELEEKDKETPLGDRNAASAKSTGLSTIGMSSGLSSSEVPRRRQSESDNQLSRRHADTKPPLRKTVSDARATEMESSRRPFRAASVDSGVDAAGKSAVARQWSTDKSKTFTRQSSKPSRTLTSLPKTRSYRRDIV